MLEMLFSTRSWREMSDAVRDIRMGFEVVATVEADFDRAIEVMRELSRTGHHKSLPVPSLRLPRSAQALPSFITIKTLTSSRG